MENGHGLHIERVFYGNYRVTDPGGNMEPIEVPDFLSLVSELASTVYNNDPNLFLQEPELDGLLSDKEKIVIGNIRQLILDRGKLENKVFGSGVVRAV